jgi:tRNA threonylcarbamoyladenosine biosynthesis protein TsaB
MMASRADDRSAPSLVIEASTYRATVAVVRGSVVLAHARVAMRGEHEERLMPAVADVLAAVGVSVRDLARVICGSGPGSFTSLRIAAALAKGLCAGATEAPRLGAVSSLELIVAGAIDRLSSGCYWASLDALRGERYAALISVILPDVSASAPARVEPPMHSGGGGGNGAPSQTAPQPVRRIQWDGSWGRVPTAELIDRAERAHVPMIGPDYALEAWPDAAGVIHVWDDVAEAEPVSWEPSYGRLAEAEVRRAARLMSASQ